MRVEVQFLRMVDHHGRPLLARTERAVAAPLAVEERGPDVEEIELLYYKFGKRSAVVDESWNITRCS